MKNSIKKLLAFMVTLSMVFSLSACGKGNSKAGGNVSDANKFSYWIPTFDDYGIYYERYEDNPAIQWILNQEWNGEKLDISFITAPNGTQQDAFNTMIATGDYPEIINLAYAESAKTLYDDGVVMEITEYVEKYLPNYTAFFEKHPELKKYVCETDENGKDHYYKISAISEASLVPWAGFGYRRDWVVKYAEPTKYVWDWDSDDVKQNGHPEVTPLSKALEQNNLNGWKENDVTSFTKDDGNDPNNTYTDNVIFPSGKTDPYTISDWEWMFEAFDKALDIRGLKGDTNAYVTTTTYAGYYGTGELVSSFGAGAGNFYLNPEGIVETAAISGNFKNYLSMMHEWYNKGWLENDFETRASEMFFSINETGFAQGKVGLQYIQTAALGTGLRETCVYDEDKRDAIIVGCSLPVNDVYGTEAQKFITPDTYYKDPVVNNDPVAFTVKCEGKNMEGLFTMINWKYSEEAAPLCVAGLSAEQYASMTFEPDLYKELGIDRAFDIAASDDGTEKIVATIPLSNPATFAIRPFRLFNSTIPNAMYVLPNYEVDYGFAEVVKKANSEWIKYPVTGDVLQIRKIFTEDDQKVYTKIANYMNETMSQEIPKFIKNGFDGWDSYVKKITKLGPEKVCDIYQKYVD